jgi:hypothetical protein
VKNREQVGFIFSHDVFRFMNQFLVCILGISAALTGCNCGNEYRCFTLQVDTVDIINPNPVMHKGTVVVFHGYMYYGIPMITDLLAYGFDMGPDVRSAGYGGQSLAGMVSVGPGRLWGFGGQGHPSAIE